MKPKTVERICLKVYVVKLLLGKKQYKIRNRFDTKIWIHYFKFKPKFLN